MDVSGPHFCYRKTITTLISARNFCSVFVIFSYYSHLIIQLSIQSLFFDISDTEILNIEILKVSISSNTT